MTIGEWQKRATELLKASGCPDPCVDTAWILEDTLNMTRAELRFEQGRALAASQKAQLDAMLQRRIDGEPVQYILQRADFMGLQFYVDERVLIPRQDTETLAEAAIAQLLTMPDPKVLDLCAGSGAVGLSIKTLVPHAQVTLTDISAGAVEVIRKNAHRLGAEVTIRHGNLFSPVADQKFDLIVCNPPYISAEEIPNLQREVRMEPELALNGGEDGLDFYRAIASEAPQHLLDDGLIYLEVGAGQAQDVLAIMQKGLHAASYGGIIKDLNGVERVVWTGRNTHAV